MAIARYRETNPVIIPPLTEEEINYEEELRAKLTLEDILRYDFKFAREQGLFFFDFDPPVFLKSNPPFCSRAELLEQLLSSILS